MDGALVACSKAEASHEVNGPRLVWLEKLLKGRNSGDLKDRRIERRGREADKSLQLGAASLWEG